MCLEWPSSLKFLTSSKNSFRENKLSNRTESFLQIRQTTSLINNLLIVKQACYSTRSGQHGVSDLGLYLFLTINSLVLSDIDQFAFEIYKSLQV